MRITPPQKNPLPQRSVPHAEKTFSLPGEDQAKFDKHLARLTAALMPEDDFEQSLAEQIAVNQWKLARIDRNEARIHDPGATSAEYALAIHRVYLTQTRLERSVSASIADLERYRKGRLAREKEAGLNKADNFHKGILLGQERWGPFLFCAPAGPRP